MPNASIYMTKKDDLENQYNQTKDIIMFSVQRDHFLEIIHDYLHTFCLAKDQKLKDFQQHSAFMKQTLHYYREIRQQIENQAFFQIMMDYFSFICDN